MRGIGEMLGEMLARPEIHALGYRLTQMYFSHKATFHDSTCSFIQNMNNKYAKYANAERGTCILFQSNWGRSGIYQLLV